MTEHTRNGFVVLPPNSPHLTVVKVGGRDFIVAKSAAVLWRRWLTFLNAVEPFTEKGWDGGYSHRKIGHSDVWSEHAAGMACDQNAAQHVQGHELPDGYTDVQVRLIRWALKNTAAGRAIHWGADFNTTPDPMHYEVRSPEILAEYNRKYPGK